MIYLMLIMIMFLYCKCEAMDPEIALETKVSVAASDNIIVKVPIALVSHLTGLKSVSHENGAAGLYSVAGLRSYYPNQHLKQLISYISRPETITHIKNKHELEATTDLLAELGAPQDIIERCRSHADACAVEDTPMPHKDLLNFGNQKLTSSIGLDAFADNYVHELNLSENRMRRFDLRYLLRLFPALRSLNCSKNDIHSLRRSMVEGMPAGFLLNISGNDISRIEKGVWQALASLRDRSVRLYLHDTRLSAKTVKNLAKQLEGVSCHRRCKQVAMKLGLASLVAASMGCAMLRGILLEKDQLQLCGNILLLGGFIFFLIGAFAVNVADSLPDCCLSDDALPSKCEWQNL